MVSFPTNLTSPPSPNSSGSAYHCNTIMHFRIPVLLALATVAVADFGYQLFTDPNSVCGDDDKSMLSTEWVGDDQRARYRTCQTVANSSSKWMAFKGLAPEGWKIEVFGLRDCGGNWLTTRPGGCLHAVANPEARDPHEIKSFRFVK